MQAMDIAIEQGQRGIIQAMIEGGCWKEAFRIPSTSDWPNLRLMELGRAGQDIEEADQTTWQRSSWIVAVLQKRASLIKRG